MANASNIFDLTGESLSTFLAKSIGDGTYDDVFGTLKVDEGGQAAAATGIATAVGQLWGNGFDDYLQATYDFTRNVARATDPSIGEFILRGITYTFPAADGTSGYVLSTDGAGALSWAPPGGTETLAQTLAAGNVTGGTDLEVTEGDRVVYFEDSQGAAGTDGNWTVVRADDFTSSGSGTTVNIGAALHTNVPGSSPTDLVKLSANGYVKVTDAGSTDIYTFGLREVWSMGSGGDVLVDAIEATGNAAFAPLADYRPSFLVDSNDMFLALEEGSSATATIEIKATVDVLVVIGGAAS